MASTIISSTPSATTSSTAPPPSNRGGTDMSFHHVASRTDIPVCLLSSISTGTHIPLRLPIMPPSMPRPLPNFRSHLTLGLCTLLHAFTHAFSTLLVPLYLLMVADLHLGGVKAASFVVTIYGLVYCLGSFPAGVLADRYNRKVLLGIGLLGNALAIALMGLTRNYETIVALGVMAGLFGTLFHPAANALVPAHYPRSPGMAIGILGMGSGVGFFAGPQFAGWRAQGWHFASIAGWQQPLFEAGLAGFLFGIFFLLVAGEARGRDQPRREIAHDTPGDENGNGEVRQVWPNSVGGVA